MELGGQSIRQLLGVLGSVKGLPESNTCPAQHDRIVALRSKEHDGVRGRSGERALVTFPPTGVASATADDPACLPGRRHDRRSDGST